MGGGQPCQEETVDLEALGALAGNVTVGLGQARAAESGGPGSWVGGAAFMGVGGVRAGRRCFRVGASQLRLRSPREGKQRPFLEQTGGK